MKEDSREGAKARSKEEEFLNSLEGRAALRIFAPSRETRNLEEHKRIAIKVIDPRGNEVMRVHTLTP